MKTIANYSSLVDSVQGTYFSSYYASGPKPLIKAAWPGYCVISIDIPKGTGIPTTGIVMYIERTDETSQTGGGTIGIHIASTSVVTVSFQDSSSTSYTGKIVNKFTLADLYSTNSKAITFWVFYTSPTTFLLEDGNDFNGITIGYGDTPSLETTAVKFVPPVGLSWNLAKDCNYLQVMSGSQSTGQGKYTMNLSTYSTNLATINAIKPKTKRTGSGGYGFYILGGSFFIGGVTLVLFLMYSFYRDMNSTAINKKQTE